MNLGKLPKEYRKLKENCPDDILLYQVGVFYKIMYEDAKKVAGPLALKLFVTGEAADPVPICGFPKSGLDKICREIGPGKNSQLPFAIRRNLMTAALKGKFQEIIRCGVEALKKELTCHLAEMIFGRLMVVRITLDI